MNSLRLGRPGMLFAGLLILAPVALRAQDAPHPDAPRVFQFDRASPDQRIDVLITRRARLGVSINFLAQETDTLGALVNGVSPNSPASRAGLRAGDLITRINGRPLVVEGIRVRRGQSAPGVRLSELASQLDAGDTVTVQYRRGGRGLRTVTLIAADEPALAWNGPDGTFGYVIGDSHEAVNEALRRGEEGIRRSIHLRVRPDSPGADSVVMLGGTMAGPYMRTPQPPMFMMLGTPLEHLELAPLNVELGRYFDSERGVLVIRAPEESQLGLEGGDVILRVDGRNTSSPAHLLRMLRSYAPAETVKFEILRMKKKTIVKGTIGPP